MIPEVDRCLCNNSYPAQVQLCFFLHGGQNMLVVQDF